MKIKNIKQKSLWSSKELEKCSVYSTKLWAQHNTANATPTEQNGLYLDLRNADLDKDSDKTLPWSEGRAELWDHKAKDSSLGQEVKDRWAEMILPLGSKGQKEFSQGKEGRWHKGRSGESSVCTHSNPGQCGSGSKWKEVPGADSGSPSQKWKKERKL